MKYRVRVYVLVVKDTRKNEQLDQRCQQLVAMLFSTTCYNVVLHPINNCCQQALFTVVGTTIVHG